MKRASPSYTTLRAIPTSIWALAAGSLINRFGSFVLPFLVLYLHHNGFNASQAGLALAAYGAGKIVAAPLGGYLADLLGPRNATALSMFSSAGTMLTLWAVTNAGPTVVYAAALATGGPRSSTGPPSQR